MKGPGAAPSKYRCSINVFFLPQSSIGSLLKNQTDFLFSIERALREAKGVMGSPSGSDSKESTCNTGDPGLLLGLGRHPGEGKGNPLRYSCLGNSMYREAWWATVHWDRKQSDTTERLTLSHFPLQGPNSL